MDYFWFWEWKKNSQNSKKFNNSWNHHMQMIFIHISKYNIKNWSDWKLLTKNVHIFNEETYYFQHIGKYKKWHDIIFFWSMKKIKEKFLAFTKFPKNCSHFQKIKNPFNFFQNFMLLCRKQCEYNYWKLQYIL